MRSVIAAPSPAGEARAGESKGRWRYRRRRAMETRPDAVDPPSAADLTISQMLRRWAPNLDARRDPRSMTIVWRGKSRSARPARKTSLFGKPTFGGPTETKKPGPSLLQVASPVWRGSPVRLRLSVCSRWLTGLLSGSPPTDTRPQARAKLGKEISTQITPSAQAFFRFFSTPAGGRRGLRRSWLT